MAIPPVRINVDGGHGRHERPRTEGRIARSSRLLGEAWRYLRRRPRLLAAPALSALAAIAVAVLVVVPLDAGRHPGLRTMIALFAWSLPLTFVTVFFNVSFLTMVREEQAGRTPSLVHGLRTSAALLPAILGWTLLTWLVGTLFGLLQSLPLVGGLIGRILGIIGGLAWGLATFFVVPVLVLDHAGPVSAVRQSARTFRARWGEAAVGSLSVGAVFGLVMLPGVWMLMGGIGAGGDGVVWVTLGLAWMGAAIAVSSAVDQLFGLQLYREADDGPWAHRDLRPVPKRRRRWISRGRGA